MWKQMLLGDRITAAKSKLGMFYEDSGDPEPCQGRPVLPPFIHDTTNQTGIHTEAPVKKIKRHDTLTTKLHPLASTFNSNHPRQKKKKLGLGGWGGRGAIWWDLKPQGCIFRQSHTE